MLSISMLTFFNNIQASAVRWWIRSLQRRPFIHHQGHMQAY